MDWTWFSGAMQTMGEWWASVAPQTKGTLLGAGIAGAMAVTIAQLNYRRSIRPVLIFYYKQKDGWYLHNVGSGPAIRVIVANADNDKKWKMPTLYASIPKDGSPCQ